MRKPTVVICHCKVGMQSERIRRWIGAPGRQTGRLAGRLVACRTTGIMWIRQRPGRQKGKLVGRMDGNAAIGRPASPSCRTGHAAGEHTTTGWQASREQASGHSGRQGGMLSPRHAMNFTDPLYFCSMSITHPIINNRYTLLMPFDLTQNRLLR